MSALMLTLLLLRTLDVSRERQAELLAIAGLTHLEIANLMETTSGQVEKWLLPHPKSRRVSGEKRYFPQKKEEK